MAKKQKGFEDEPIKIQIDLLKEAIDDLCCHSIMISDWFEIVLKKIKTK
ncbi:MAG: hypothetical protein NTU76_03755 [Candidatus Taylorbacteria bacterium]|nr:hypothetical protein [Candidatus Taylorbacteria bacterium]